MNDEGYWRYWYLASPHMKDICNSLTTLSKNYGKDIEIISVTLNHQNYIVLYKYWTTGEDAADVWKGGA